LKSFLFFQVPWDEVCRRSSDGRAFVLLYQEARCTAVHFKDLHANSTVVNGQPIMDTSDVSAILNELNEHKGSSKLVPNFELVEDLEIYLSQLESRPKHEEDLKTNPEETESECDSELEMKTSDSDKEEKVPSKNKKQKLATIHYKNKEGKFKINAEHWNKVYSFETGKIFDRRTWTTIFKEHIQAFRPHCKIKFGGGSGRPYSTKKSEEIHVSAYAVCGRGECKFYSLFFSPKRGEDLIVNVQSAGEENHDAALTKTTQVRGGEKDMFQTQLKEKTAHMFKQEKIHDLDPLIRHSNNLQDVKSDAVYRSIKSHAISEDDLHRDDFIDLVFMRRNELDCDPELRYIQMVAEPLMVYLFSSVAIKVIYSYFTRKSKVTCHFDATGKFIRSMNFYGKTIYFYSCIVNINAMYLPLFNLISCQHDQDSIGTVLGKFRRFCENDLKWEWPCLGRIVCDCSFAIIHAIMRYWNSTSLQSYLANCYQHCAKIPTAKSWAAVVLVRLCKNHWVKMCCSNLKQHSISGKPKALIVEAMLILMEAKTLSQFDHVFENLVAILVCKVKHTGLVKAFEALGFRGKYLATEFDEPDIQNIADELDEHKFVSKDPLDSTPFHKHCRNITAAQEEAASHLPDVTTDSKDFNPFYCPVFLEEIFFRNHYAALVPLWTSLMDEMKTDRKGFVATNGPVEGYYKIKKKHIHPNTHDKPGRFIKKDREYVLANVKSVLLRLRTDGKEFVDQDHGEESDVDDPVLVQVSISQNDTVMEPVLNVTQTAEEKWDTPRPKFSYSEGRTIKRINDKLCNSKGEKVNKQQTPLSTGKKGRQTPKKGRGTTMDDLLGKVEVWHRSFKEDSPSSACVAGRNNGKISCINEAESMSAS